MICLQQGEHIPQTQYGILGQSSPPNLLLSSFHPSDMVILSQIGVLAAVIWFPVGIACCLLDRKVKCKRCGEIINSGIMD